MNCFSLESVLIQSHFTVCYDVDPPNVCKTTIDADRTGQICNEQYMVDNCKKSCAFCPGRTFYCLVIYSTFQ